MYKKDPLNESRIKSKFILEIRYPPLVTIFDKRGKILENIYPHFKMKAKHWNVDNAQVLITDDLGKNSRQFIINHLKASITYEDSNSRSEFIDDCINFIKLLYEVFPEINTLNRIGFRSICIFRNKNAKTFSDVFSSIKSKFISPTLPLKLNYNDFNLNFTHETCNVHIGPVKEGEDWIKTYFIHTDKNIPKFGIGFDIDSFAKDLSSKNSTDFISAFDALNDLSTSVESEMLSGLV
jgi:hypothetical protein